MIWVDRLQPITYLDPTSGDWVLVQNVVYCTSRGSSTLDWVDGDRVLVTRHSQLSGNLIEQLVMGYTGGQAMGVPAERTCKNCKGGKKILEGSRIHDIAGELISNGMLPYKQDALYNQLWDTSKILFHLVITSSTRASSRVYPVFHTLLIHITRGVGRTKLEPADDPPGEKPLQCHRIRHQDRLHILGILQPSYHITIRIVPIHTAEMDFSANYLPSGP